MRVTADRVLKRIAAAFGGGGSIYAGFAAKAPGNSITGWLVGWSLIVFGVIVLFAVVASIVPLPRGVDSRERARRRVDAPTLPEARVHDRPPDSRNGK